MSSLTAELTEVITCELAINRTVAEGSRFIAHETEEVYLAKIRVFLRPATSQRRSVVLLVRHICFAREIREEHVISHRPMTSKRKLTTSCGVERTFSPGAIISYVNNRARTIKKFNIWQSNYSIWIKTWLTISTSHNDQSFLSILTFYLLKGIYEKDYYSWYSYYSLSVVNSNGQLL